MIVTFDLFSALTDSRTGASVCFAALAAGRSWPVTGTELYDAWDHRSKALQREARSPTSFAEVSATALADAYADLGLDSPAGAVADMAAVHARVGDWPLWTDVAEGVAGVAALPSVRAVGLLSNVDDDLARRTRAAALVEDVWVLTSQGLGAFKPDPAIYRAAADAASPEPLVHVAASARDVRGAVEAGLAVVRLVRPGHALDPDGPAPAYVTDDARQLADLVGRAAGAPHRRG